MANAIEYALMAGRAYQTTRGEINWFPDLLSLGWTESFHAPVPGNGFTFPATEGFEAISFTNGNEIVISFAGTGTNVDWWANAGGFFGVSSDQLEQAASYYLLVKDANPPGTKISFTGHSLGGGLASLMAVFFGETAVTFDQAPFRNSASVSVAETLLSYLSDPARGYSAQDLQGLTNFISAAANGGVPNESNVLDFSVQGEILSAASFARIGTQSSLTHGPNNWFGSSVDLHSQALLTAFLQSNQTADPFRSLSDVTLKLTDLLKMIFDSALFAYPTDQSDENFIERLVRHQNGVAGLTAGELPVAADAMVTRFTSDLWKLAQEGGMTMTDNNTNTQLNEVSKTLTAFVMQKYYEETSSSDKYKKELFTQISGGIQFDLADVSTKIKAALDAHKDVNLNDAKGYELYFRKYLMQVNAGLTEKERGLIETMLPTLRDWYIQAGAGGMTATDILNRNAFMLGGIEDDFLTGGTGDDLLVGNTGDDTLDGGAGNDVLLGGKGSDTLKGGEGNDLLLGGKDDDTLDGGDGNDLLKGGEGNDTYTFSGNYGIDIVSDSEGIGSIKVDGQTLTGGTTKILDNIYKDDTGAIYVKLNDGNSLVLLKDNDHNRIIVNDWPLGNKLGLSLQGEIPAAPATTLSGDFKKAINDQGTADTGDDTYVMTNGNYTPDPDAPNEANALDLISGTAGDDVIDGGGGDDALSGMNGDDYIEGGAGSDLIQGGLGKDTINGGAGDDIIYGSSDMVISKPGSVNFTKPVNPYPFPEATGFNWSSGYYETYPNGVPMGFSDAPRNRLDGDQGNIIDGGSGNDFIAAGTGADYVHGGTDMDLIYGMDKADILFGDGGNDIIYGDGNMPGGNSVIWTLPENHGNDIIDGGDGDDYLIGQGGNDIIFGGADNDKIWGDEESEMGLSAGGNDFLFGGGGTDQLSGGGGEDTLDGGADNDQLNGGSGNDTLIGGTGADNLYGGAGDDTYLDVDAGDVIGDLEGHSTIKLATANSIYSSTAPTVTSTPDSTLIITLDNGTQLNLQGALYGMNTTLEFANGTALDLETWVSENLTDAVSLNLSSVALSSGGLVERAYGGAGADQILGGIGNDNIKGYGGNDFLQGGAGNDLLDGGAGNDALLGGAGNDTLLGGAGNDELQGNEGNDVLDGGSGEDVLFGGAGADSLLGGDGSDRLVAGEGADILESGAGNDLLWGEGGNDTLSGGAGDDRLVGGAGGDQYLVALGDGVDVIADQEGINTIQFGAGIELTQMRLSQTGATSSSGNYVISYGVNDHLVIKTGADFSSMKFAFTNGTVLTSSQLLAQLLPGGQPTKLTRIGTSANDFISTNTLDGYLLIGAAGNDAVWSIVA